MNQYSILLLIIIAPCYLFGQRTVTLNFVPYPLTKKDVNILLKTAKEKKQTTRKQLSSILKPASTHGIFSSYSGYLVVSDDQGFTEFVRKHSNPTFHIIVTTDIHPIRTFGMTIHHWELNPNAQAAFYIITREIDPASGSCYWETDTIKNLDSPTIPLDAIIIFAQPESIFIPKGITPCSDAGENLILPPMYIRKDNAHHALHPVINALRVTEYSLFMRPEKRIMKKENVVTDSLLDE